MNYERSRKMRRKGEMRMQVQKNVRLVVRMRGIGGLAFKQLEGTIRSSISWSRRIRPANERESGE